MKVTCVLAAVQIIAESLPVSSSGVVAVVTKIVKVLGYGGTDLSQNFDFALHGFTVVIITWYFWRFIYQEFFARERFSGKRLVKFVIAGGIVDGITALFYYIKELGIIHKAVLGLPIGFLITTGALFSLWFKQKREKKFEKLEVFKNTQKFGLSWHNAVILGVVQGLTVLAPGVSRFALTFVAGRWLGYKLSHAFALSFIIALPLMSAGFVQGIYGLYCSGEIGELLSWQSVLSMLIALGISGWLFAYVGMMIERNRVYFFGWFTLAMAFLSYYLSYCHSI